MLITIPLTMKTGETVPGEVVAEKFLVDKYEIAKLKFVKTIEKLIRRSEKMVNPKT